MMKKKSSAGMVSLPSIPRQASAWNILSHKEMSALATKEGSSWQSITQLIRYASRNPTVTANWYSDTRVPLILAGDTSEI